MSIKREETSGIVKNIEIGDEKSQKDYYDLSTHYDKVWGLDNIHLGYYPHLAGPAGGDMMVVLNNVQAADALTKRMIDVGRINHNSTVLDLGCGKGQGLKLLIEATGAKGVGLDIGTVNIKRANEVAAQMPHLDMKFYEGSYTELPKEVLSQKFNVIFSQVAFCHVHNELHDIFEKAKQVMAPGGIMVINDYLGCDLPGGASQFTKDNVWKRLHFEYLHGHRAWRKIAEEAGLEVQFYENLDDHMAHTYDDMQKSADKLSLKSADGTPLGNNYGATARAIRSGEVGMNLAVLTIAKSRRTMKSKL
jgi:cyclopropane fatty-acyl-phospholipid synthase-like methyltransferase